MDSKIESHERCLLEDSLLKSCHSGTKSEAISAYNMANQYASNNALFAVAAEVRKILELNIEEHYGTYVQKNDEMKRKRRVKIGETSEKAFEIYKRRMDSKIESQRRSLEESFLKSYHSESKSEAIAAYDKENQYANTNALFAIAAEVRAILETNIEEHYGTYVQKNDEMKRKERVKIDETSEKAFELYKRTMDSKIESQRRSLEESFLKRCHSNSKNKAIAAYNKENQYARNDPLFETAADAKKILEL
ncbi:uncharacterized protein LOC125177604, partial [Hyalella azteca]|uniref:Uncharacterized protein LOC125177604 n=1 Tax=Hyalella azteca TaxID=294128 RepID=A0A979FG59_HYAAZ